MSDYTPHTGEIRDAVSGGWDYAYITPKEFDRWLAAHDAEVRADEREKVIADLNRVIQRSECEPQEAHGGDPASWSNGFMYAARRLLAAARGDGEQA